jgi:hypothetical protein
MSVRAYSLLVLILLSCPALAEAPSREYIRGYAQGLLDREFRGLGLEALDGERAGEIIVWSKTCLSEQQRHDIGRVLLGEVLAKVEWGMPCPAAETAESITEPRPKQDMEIAGEPVEVEALPERSLFPSLQADPREPRFSMSWQRHHSEDSSFDAADVSFGETFGFAEGSWRDGRYQVGLQGAVFALFNFDSDSFDLINADYMLGLPVTWRRDASSARVRLYHQSSHLGDEFILGNPGVDRINLSYEVIDGLVSHEWQRLRLYGGGGAVVHSDPHLDPWLAQFGVEYLLPDLWGDLDLALAADFKSTDEQDWHVNQSYRAGFVVASHNQRKVRLLLQHYRGLSPNGQFFSDRLHYSGVGLYFGF